MKIIKKATALLLAIVCMAVFFGCSEKKPKTDKNKLSIVTTVFAQYDFVENILGDRAGDADVTYLLKSGVDMHSFNPTTQDLIKIQDADILIYVGGESDKWIGDFLKESPNKSQIRLNLLDIIGKGAYEEEEKEGMKSHEHKEFTLHKREAGKEEAEYDEHVWLSLKNSEIIVSSIAKAIEKADPKNKMIYEKNAENYTKKLSDLEKRYKAAVKHARVRTLVFADRFPFLYMVKDLGLDYFAAFAGCSAESEAGFDTISFLAQKVNDENISTILTIDGSDKRIARLVRDNTKKKNMEICELDSMQSVKLSDIKSGKTYLNTMEKNLEILKIALK